MTISTVYSDAIAEGNNAFSITGISVPADADIAVLIVHGYANTAPDDDMVDVSNFDADTDDHFTAVVHGGDGDEPCVAIYALKYGETGFPTRGATGQTLTVELADNVRFGGGFAQVFFLSGFKTDGTYLIGTDFIDNDSGGWTCDSLGTVGAGDIGIIAGTGFQSTVESTPGGSGQTELSEGNVSDTYHGSAYELNEDQLTLDYAGSFFGGVACAIAASPAGGLSIPVAMHHYTKNIRSS